MARYQQPRDIFTEASLDIGGIEQQIVATLRAIGHRPVSTEILASRMFRDPDGIRADLERAARHGLIRSVHGRGWIVT